MSGHGAAVSTEGLPKQFVTSLRILFDILDEERTGYVRLCDIESRWHEEGVRGLPSGVIDSLRKVAPKTGKLNFETFVNGLKLSLLKTSAVGGTNLGKGHPLQQGKEKKTRPISDPPKGKPDSLQPRPGPGYKASQREFATASNSQHSRHAHSSRQLSQQSNTATVRPNNVLQSQNVELRNQIYTREQQQQSSIRQHAKPDVVFDRTKADQAVYRDRTKAHDHLKQGEDNYTRRKAEQKPRPKSVELQRTRDLNFSVARQTDIPPGRPERPPPYRSPPEHHDLASAGRPDRPPPYRKQLDKEPPPTIPPRNGHGRIMQELKQWQQDHNFDFQGKMHTTHSDSKLLEKNKENDIYVNIEQIRQQAATFKKSAPPSATQNAQPVPASSTTQNAPVRRQNSRRHTLSSGIDYNVIRRMKQLEQEKDELLAGLESVDRARDWYLRQIAALAEKQSYADKTSCSDMTLQANQERMNFIRSRISEVNLNLRSLMESSEKGFPAHMNLAMRSDTVPVDNSMKWLKDQNRQLTKEVGGKSEKITQLEKEKASLIRDLFEARSRHKTNYDDTTFM